MVARLALAPVNWNNDDVPEWGQTLPYAQMPRVAAGLGYAGLEEGTGAPAEPLRLRDLMASAGVRLCGSYRWVRLADADLGAAEVEAAVAHASRLAQAGADTLLVAEHWTDARRAVAGRAAQHPELALGPRALDHLARNLNRLGRAAADLGVQVVLHPHVGTPVETAAEMDAVLQATDPALVGLCLDTGHLVWAGADPLDVARRHGRRIRYVHDKDVDRLALSEAVRQKVGLLDGLRLGVFAPLYSTPEERSAVNMEAVAAVLVAAGFGGWVVMECDRNPRTGNPTREAEVARPRLERAFALPRAGER